MSSSKATTVPREAQLDLERFVSLSVDMLCIAGFDGYFKYVNAAWEKTLGWTVEELTTEPWSHFVHPDDLERTIAEADKQTKQGLDAISFKNRYRAKDGSYHWLEWHSRPSVEHEEMHAIARDVTEQRAAEMALEALNESLERKVVERTRAADARAEQAEIAEQALRTQEDLSRRGVVRMRYFLEHLPLGIALIGEHMQYLFVSERFKQDFQLRDEDILDIKHTDVFPGADDTWGRVYAGCATGATLRSDETEFTLRGGNREWVQWRADPWRTPEGDMEGMVLYTELVTERKEAEVRLREVAVDLTRSNAELEAFTYSVSHDLKEPLRSIEAFSQFLLEDYGGKLDDEGKDYLNKLARASARMKHLIEDLLTLSRVGRRAEPPAAVALDSIIADVVDGMRITVQERGAVVHVAPGLPNVLADPRRIEQIYGNLISNAMKFNRNDTPRVEIGASVDDAAGAVFFVRDNGIGIEPQYHEKVFGVFQRLHRREEFEGTGAGLAIVKRAVEALGGSIWLDSSLGGGSTFKFTLPVVTLSEAPSPTAEIARQEAFEFRRERPVVGAEG